MFANLLDLAQPAKPTPEGPGDRSRPLRRATRPRGAPSVPDRHLPELELDRYLNYWALTAKEPSTATVRSQILEARLKSLLDRDPILAGVLMAHPGPDGATLGSKWPGLRVWLCDQMMTAWRDASQALPHRRRIVATAVFEQHLFDTLNGLNNPDLRRVIGMMGIDHLVGLAGKALRLTAQEQVLATQLKTTAQVIRGLEAKLTNNTLPPEDLYELKLRRDLFMTDLRAYARAVRG